jgi:hypothetical protein
LAPWFVRQIVIGDYERQNLYRLDDTQKPGRKTYPPPAGTSEQRPNFSESRSISSQIGGTLAIVRGFSYAQAASAV